MSIYRILSEAETVDCWLGRSDKHVSVHVLRLIIARRLLLSDAMFASPFSPSDNFHLPMMPASRAFYSRSPYICSRS